MNEECEVKVHHGHNIKKCANALDVSFNVIKDFDTDQIFDGFICHIENKQNSNAIFSISMEGSSSTPANCSILIEQNKELIQKNDELYERLLQAEKEKVAFLEKMLAEKDKV